MKTNHRKWILALETSLNVCSVSVGYGNHILASREETGVNIHAKRLGVLIEETMASAGINFDALAAVSVSKGPGSYTGLRIGVSAAKGICFAKEIPLIGISTLEILATQAKIYHKEKDVFYCPLIDARRMEVYYTLYNEAIDTILPIEAAVIDEAFVEKVLSDRRVLFFGNGMEKAKSLLQEHKKAMFLENILPSASLQISIASERIANNQTEALSSFEPFYLKDFIAKNPSLKIAKILNG